MPDELGPIFGKRGIAEDVVGMTMRIDDIAHRHGGDAPDRLSKRAAHGVRPPGIDHRDATAADDESEVGDVAQVCAAHLGLLSVVDIHAGRRVLEREFRYVRRRRGRDERPRKGDPTHEERNPASVSVTGDHRRDRRTTRC